jgi:hypothetical protein
MKAESTLPYSSWSCWLPGFLLIAVAISQIVLATTADLSPWKGGGFGMFSTIDGTASRDLRIFAEAPGRSEQLEIAPSQELMAARSELYPSDKLLKDLAAAVVDRERRYRRPVTIVRIEVWRIEFNEDLEAIERPIRTFEWNVDETPNKSRE